ncbi:MAG: hypothetical protein EOP19_00200 [Hyphomicrobiales bacterium]|nr:MAG: hypothetical protein EOP19_00200 [Hyphomicrobiales bacterium]
MSDPGAARRRIVFRLLIEGFTVVSAVAFVVSAVLNAHYFDQRWQLSYFDVATPTDVLMGGFVVISYLSIPLVAATVFGAFWFLFKYRVRPGDTYEAARTRLQEMDRRVFRLPFLAVGFSALLFALSSVLPGRPDDATGLRMSQLADAISTARGEPHMALAPDARVAPECARGSILWSGSLNVVVQCRNDTRVLRNTADLPAIAIRAKKRHATSPPPVER